MGHHRGAISNHVLCMVCLVIKVLCVSLDLFIICTTWRGTYHRSCRGLCASFLPHCILCHILAASTRVCSFAHHLQGPFAAVLVLCLEVCSFCTSHVAWDSTTIRHTVFSPHHVLSLQGGVAAVFREGSSGAPVVVRTKLLVGADGINSRVRATLVGDTPRYLRCIDWNALIPNPGRK